MTSSIATNGRIPTDPHTALALALAITYTAGQLTPDQTSALIATGGIAELALYVLRLTRERR